MGLVRARAEGCLPLHQGFPTLTIRGFVHCIPELEASRMLIPQFLQLGPQQDVFLGLQETGHPVKTGDSGTALGDLNRDSPKGESSRPCGPHSAAQRQMPKLTGILVTQWLSPATLPTELLKAAGQQAPYKQSL